MEFHRVAAAKVMTPSIPGADRVSEWTRHRAQVIGVESDGVTQRVRQGRDPSAQGGMLGQDMLHRFRRALVHAPMALSEAISIQAQPRADR